MKKFAAVVLFAVLVLALVYAAGPKTYQVTGPVLDIKGDVITVQKDQDKWELLKTADTTITGKLAVGAKVKIEYKMVATKITVQ
jgi:hypothetical protein